jgi:small conductance mechanosensitive channel
VGRTADYWPLLFDVTEKVKLEFDRQGISIPFPQTDVHVSQVAARAEENWWKSG